MSSYLKLDSDVILNDSGINADIHEEQEMQMENDELVLLGELKKKVYGKNSKASSCRELMNQIKNLTYLIYDNDALDYAHETLTKLLETMSYHAPKEDNLVLRILNWFMSWPIVCSATKTLSQKVDFDRMSRCGCGKAKFGCFHKGRSWNEKKSVTSKVIEEFPSFLEDTLLV